MAGWARQRALEEAGLLHPAPEAVTASAFVEQPEFFAAFDKVQVKYEMLRAHLVAGETVTAAAAAHGYRLLDAYQAALLDLDELTRRTAALTARRDQLASEHTELTNRRAELTTENRLRRGLAGFAERVLASLDELDFDGRQRLLRMVVEKVRVTGWRVEIHLKIPLTDDDPGTQREPRPPNAGPGPSSDMGLRSVDGAQRRLLPPARQRPRRPTGRNRLTDHPRRPRRGPQTASYEPVFSRDQSIEPPQARSRRRARSGSPSGFASAALSGL